MSIPTLIQFVRDQEGRVSNEHLILYLMLRGSVADQDNGRDLNSRYYYQIKRIATFADIQLFGLGDQAKLSLNRLVKLGWVKLVEFERKPGIELADNDGQWYADQNTTTLGRLLKNTSRNNSPTIQAPATPPKPPHRIRPTVPEASPKIKAARLLRIMSNMNLEKYDEHYPGCSSSMGITGKLLNQGRNLLALFHDDTVQTIEYLEYCFENWDTIVRQFNLKLSDKFQLGVAANPGFCQSIRQMRKSGPHAVVTSGDRADSTNPEKDDDDWD